jgi:hypothetical protein
MVQYGWRSQEENKENKTRLASFAAINWANHACVSSSGRVGRPLWVSDDRHCKSRKRDYLAKFYKHEWRFTLEIEWEIKWFLASTLSSSCKTIVSWELAFTNSLVSLSVKDYLMESRLAVSLNEKSVPSQHGVLISVSAIDELFFVENLCWSYFFETSLCIFLNPFGKMSCLQVKALIPLVTIVALFEESTSSLYESFT